MKTVSDYADFDLITKKLETTSHERLQLTTALRRTNFIQGGSLTNQVLHWIKSMMVAQQFYYITVP